jgi:hypothetical protein
LKKEADMSKKELEVTIKLARALIGRLPDDTDSELKNLVQRAEQGEDTTVEIIDLLSPHENVRLWMRDQLSSQTGTKGSGTRGFGQLAGKPGSISASQLWVCPEGDKSLPVIQEGENPPICEVHGLPMILASEKQG